VKGFWGTVDRQLIFLKVLLLILVTILILFIYAGLPFYWITGLFLSFFAGLRLPGMLTIYSQFFWGIMSLISFLMVGLFYLPFQKVFLYVFYVELNYLKQVDKTDAL
jgi:small-conductance mechanosensitive channel